MGEVTSRAVGYPRIDLAKLYLYQQARKRFLSLFRKIEQEKLALNNVLAIYLGKHKELVRKHNALVHDMLVQQKGLQDSDFGYVSFLEGDVYGNYAKLQLCKRLFRQVASKTHPDRVGENETFLMARAYLDDLNVEGLHFLANSFKEHSLHYQQTEGILVHTKNYESLVASKAKRNSGLSYTVGRLHFKDKERAEEYTKTYLQTRIALLHIQILGKPNDEEDTKV